MIRRTSSDLHGRPLDDNARACLQLADVTREDLQRGESVKPIELTRSHVDGLCEYVIGEDEIGSIGELADLCDALERYG